MKKYIYLLTVLLIANNVLSQQSKEFTKLFQNADSLYRVKEYKECGEKYSQAFKLYKKNIINPIFWYNYACTLALANEIDLSFDQLFYLAKKRNFNNYLNLVADSDLTNLHTDKRWEELLKIISNNEKKLNKPLIAELDSILKDDQTYRVRAMELEQKFGVKSDEAKEVWNMSEQKDSINQTKIFKILDYYGWPDSSIIGINGSETIFLVIQHSDKEMRLKYLPLMKKAVKKGNAQSADLALLEDRTAIDCGKKQIYGSQLSIDKETQKPFFDIKSLINLKKIDKKRNKIGLQPIAEYLGNWNIIWNSSKEKLYPEN